MSPSTNQPADTSQSMSQLDDMGAALDSAIETVLSAIAEAVNATGQAAADGVADVKKLLTGQISDLAAQVDSDLTGVINLILQELANQEQLTASLADTIVLQIQQAYPQFGSSTAAPSGGGVKPIPVPPAPQGSVGGMRLPGTTGGGIVPVPMPGSSGGGAIPPPPPGAGASPSLPSSAGGQPIPPAPPGGIPPGKYGPSLPGQQPALTGSAFAQPNESGTGSAPSVAPGIFGDTGPEPVDLGNVGLLPGASLPATGGASGVEVAGAGSDRNPPLPLTLGASIAPPAATAPAAGPPAPCPPPVVNCPPNGPVIINLQIPGQPGVPIVVNPPGAPVVPAAPAPAGPGAPAPPATVPKPALPPGGIGTFLASQIQPGSFACQNFGLIGSPDWCKGIPQTAQTLSKVGNVLIGIANQLDQLLGDLPLSPPDWYHNTLGMIPFGIGTALDALYRVGAELWDAVVDTLKAATKVAAQLQACSGCKDSATLTGCIVARGMISALKGVSGGINLFVQGGFAVTIQWDQAEAVIDYIVHWLCPFEAISPETAMDLRNREWITDHEWYRCLMKIGNRDPDTWDVVKESMRQRPGIGERQELLYRSNAGYIPAGVNFKDADYEGALVTDGYSTANREWLAFLKYRVIAIRQIRELGTAGQVTDAQINAALLAEGFSADDAQRMTRMERVLIDRAIESQIHGYTPTTIAKLWQCGKLDAVQVQDKMERLGYTAEQAKTLREVALIECDKESANVWSKKAIAGLFSWLEKSYKEGLTTGAAVITRLLAVGCPADAAALMIETWNGEIQLANIEAAKRCIKNGWDTGFVSNLNAQIDLELAGYTVARANQILGQWQACRADSEKLLSAGQVIDAFKAGLISGKDALARIEAYGYNVKDAEYIIAMAQQAVDKQQAASAKANEKAEQAAAKAAATASKQAAAAAAKAAAAAVKQAEQLAKQSAAAAKAAQAVLLKHTPVSVLNAALKEGQISQFTYQNRMAILGYDQNTIAVMIAEICHASGAACVAESGPADQNVVDITAAEQVGE